MQIIDINEQYEATYCVCLEDWSDEMHDAGDHKARWYHEMKDRGLRVKLAVDGRGRAVGMIQYGPIELGPAIGEDLYMILCVWVHGYESGVGDHQGQGIGTELLEAAEADALQLGAKGMAAWGMALPFWMKASWFKKHGYSKADRHGISELVWKAFTPDAVAPQWIPEGDAPPAGTDKVAVTAYLNGWCPAANSVYERARMAASEFGDAVDFTTVDTREQLVRIDVGHSDAVFVDGKPLQRGAPPTYEEVHAAIEKRVRRRQRGRPGKGPAP